MADSPRIEELKRRVQLDPASIAFAALAEEFRRAERYEEAIETCAAGLVRHPSYLSAHVTLGRSLMEVGRLPEAQQELEFVLKLAPENLAAIRGLAEIHHRLGDDQQHPDFHNAEHHAPPTEPETPALISAAEVQAAVEAVAPPVQQDHQALAGLEQFLNTIIRARTRRSAAR